MNILYSQVNQEWISRYGSNGIDGGNSVATDNNGNIYVTGSDGGPTNYDFVTIKYSASGEQQWLVRYNGPGNGSDGAYKIKLDNESNVIVTGESEGIATGADYTTIKYNSSGAQQWIVRYSTSGNHRDAAYDLAIDNSSNIYVTGESENSIGGTDFLTIKYDSSGNQLWIARYNRGINSFNQAFAITNDNSGNVFVTGNSNGDFATVKYNSSGEEQWFAIYDGPVNGDDVANAIVVDTLGNMYVAGSSTGMYYRDYATIKYNSLGIQQWVRRYNGTANYIDQIRSMKLDKFGNIYVTGQSTEIGHGYDFTTIKYNSDGVQLWIAHYHNGLNDFGNALEIDNSGNVYVTGESDGNGTGYDYATIKYDSSGNQLWVMRYDYSGQYGDYPSAIAVDNIGNVYVTGSSNRDFLTIKYHQIITGINPVSSEIPFEFKLKQNYPNPFNPKTVINYDISSNVKRQTSDVKLIIYNTLGKEIATLVNQKQSAKGGAGSYSVEFDGSNYPSGVYLYRLMIDGNIIDTKRMILLK